MATIQPSEEKFGLWLTPSQAQQFIPCKSLKSTYQWLKNHGIERRNNGTVLRRDLERELARRKPRRVMHPNSLRNLRVDPVVAPPSAEAVP